MYFGVSQKIHSSRYLYIIENSSVHMESALLSIQNGRSKLQIVENSKCQYIEKICDVLQHLNVLNIVRTNQLHTNKTLKGHRNAILALNRFKRFLDLK